MLKPKALGLTLGIFWAVMSGGIMLISLWTGYAKELLETIGPVHPGYSYSYLGAFIFAAEHFVCGLVSGTLFALVYNKFAK